jgi:hypothetical protein
MLVQCNKGTSESVQPRPVTVDDKPQILRRRHSQFKARPEQTLAGVFINRFNRAICLPGPLVSQIAPAQACEDEELSSRALSTMSHAKCLG